MLDASTSNNQSRVIYILYYCYLQIYEHYHTHYCIILILLIIILGSYLMNPPYMTYRPTKNYQHNSAFQQERTHYESIIEQLTQENQQLKQQLKLLTQFKLQHQHPQPKQTQEDENKTSDLMRSQKSTIKTSRPTTVVSKPAMKHTSQELRQTQSTLNPTEVNQSQYEQKINELATFLTNIKQKSFLPPSLNKSTNDDKNYIKIVQTMQQLIKMFQKDRAVFIKKIEQLLLLIGGYQKRQKEYLSKQRRFQLDLNIANQQLVIFKRLKKTK